MTIGAQEFKEIVWKAMADSIAEKITYEEFRARIEKASVPTDIRKMASNQSLSHNGLCIRGGIVEKVLTRFNIIG